MLTSKVDDGGLLSTDGIVAAQIGDKLREPFTGLPLAWLIGHRASDYRVEKFFSEFVAIFAGIAVALGALPRRSDRHECLFPCYTDNSRILTEHLLCSQTEIR